MCSHLSPINQGPFFSLSSAVSQKFLGGTSVVATADTGVLREKNSAPFIKRRSLFLMTSYTLGLLGKFTLNSVSI